MGMWRAVATGAVTWSLLFGARPSFAGDPKDCAPCKSSGDCLPAGHPGRPFSGADDSFADGLIEILENDRDEDHRLSAVAQLVQVPRYRPEILRALEEASRMDPSIQVRRAAMLGVPRYRVASKIAKMSNEPDRKSLRRSRAPQALLSNIAPGEKAPTAAAAHKRHAAEANRSASGPSVAAKGARPAASSRAPAPANAPTVAKAATKSRPASHVGKVAANTNPRPGARPKLAARSAAPLAAPSATPSHPDHKPIVTVRRHEPEPGGGPAVVPSFRFTNDDEAAAGTVTITESDPAEDHGREATAIAAPSADSEVPDAELASEETWVDEPPMTFTNDSKEAQSDESVHAVAKAVPTAFEPAVNDNAAVPDNLAVNDNPADPVSPTVEEQAVETEVVATTEASEFTNDPETPSAKPAPAVAVATDASDAPLAPSAPSTTASLENTPPEPAAASNAASHEYPSPEPPTALNTSSLEQAAPAPPMATTTASLEQTPPEPVEASATASLEQTPPEHATATTITSLKQTPPEPPAPSTTAPLEQTPPEHAAASTTASLEYPPPSRGSNSSYPPPSRGRDRVGGQSPKDTQLSAHHASTSASYPPPKPTAVASRPKHPAAPKSAFTSLLAEVDSTKDKTRSTRRVVSDPRRSLATLEDRLAHRPEPASRAPAHPHGQFSGVGQRGESVRATQRIVSSPASRKSTATAPDSEAVAASHALSRSGRDLVARRASVESTEPAPSELTTAPATPMVAAAVPVPASPPLVANAHPTTPPSLNTARAAGPAAIEPVKDSPRVEVEVSAAVIENASSPIQGTPEESPAVTPQWTPKWAASAPQASVHARQETQSSSVPVAKTVLARADAPPILRSAEPEPAAKSSLPSAPAPEPVAAKPVGRKRFASPIKIPVAPITSSVASAQSPVSPPTVPNPPVLPSPPPASSPTAMEVAVAKMLPGPSVEVVRETVSETAPDLAELPKPPASEPALKVAEKPAAKVAEGESGEVTETKAEAAESEEEPVAQSLFETPRLGTVLAREARVVHRSDLALASASAPAAVAATGDSPAQGTIASSPPPVPGKSRQDKRRLGEKGRPSATRHSAQTVAYVVPPGSRTPMAVPLTGAASESDEQLAERLIHQCRQSITDHRFDEAEMLIYRIRDLDVDWDELEGSPRDLLLELSQARFETPSR